MRQQAIIFTKNNADTIAAQLAYTTAQELLDEYDYLFANRNSLVLVRDILDDGMPLLSHVVTESMFYANAKPNDTLVDYRFTNVTQL